MSQNISHLDNLIENAFDFLENSLDEFEKKPKYSIVHFNTALELFLKARLVSEHWSLVVASKDPNLAKYQNGDFLSVSMEGAINRINDATQFKISSDAANEFKKITSHRNRIVHFFHNDEQSKNQKVLEIIAVEECKSWLHLRKLFDEWKDIFSKYEKRITICDSKLATQRTFLEAKFQLIKPEIERLSKSATAFKHCSVCKFEAAKVIKFMDNIYSKRCLVCDYQASYVDLTCGECNETHSYDSISANYGVKCPCGKNISETNAINQLSQWKSQPEINCYYCDSRHSVISIDVHEDEGIHVGLCLRCLENDDVIEQCHWCGEEQLGGVSELSYHHGCTQCDGHDGVDLWD